MFKNLRRKILLLFLSSGAWLAHGQVVVGARVGINLNQFSQPGTTLGPNVGIYGSYPVTSFLTLKLEPQYSQEGGGRPDYSRNYASISDNVSSITFINPGVVFHNIQVPLLAELILPEFAEEPIAPKLILGGSYGFALSSVEQHTKRYTLLDNTLPGADPQPAMDVAYQKENVTDNYSRNQWSVWAGVGFTFKTAKRTLSFDVRYRQGLNNLNKLRFASPGNSNGTIGAPGTGGTLRSSSLSFNFSMSIFNF